MKNNRKMYRRNRNTTVDMVAVSNVIIIECVCVMCVYKLRIT